jgi:hypothetical protein
MTVPEHATRVVELPHGIPLELNIASDDTKRRGEFAIRLIELADDFDRIDHEFGPLGGTDLQDDCQAVRELARSFGK